MIVYCVFHFIIFIFARYRCSVCAHIRPVKTHILVHSAEGIISGKSFDPPRLKGEHKSNLSKAGILLTQRQPDASFTSCCRHIVWHRNDLHLNHECHFISNHYICLNSMKGMNTILVRISNDWCINLHLQIIFYSII